MSEPHESAPAAAGETHPSGTDQPELKKAITPKLLLLFIVGDILGTGVYALTGRVAGEVGGAGWLPIIIAFAVAMVSALSYVEMVTKYPQAAGAALYVHKAFGIHFLTFMVTFAVLSSGITSASTSAIFLAENVLKAFRLEEALGSASAGTATAIAILFIALIACINMYGVSESVKANVALTLIELSGLTLVILVGFFAISRGQADFSRVILFETQGDKSLFMAVIGATALAFFSMVGFEDSVNMAEETVDPVKNFPKALIGGLSITGCIYVLISVLAVAVVPIGELTSATTPLLTVVEHGAPGIPIDTIFAFISIFAVANTVLINMMMASRLLYGMAKQGVLPGFLRGVLKTRRTPWAGIVFSTLLAFVLVFTVRFVLAEETIGALGGTTALLLLTVFGLVNIAVLVLRKDKVDARHFRTPTVLPVIGAITSFLLVSPIAQPTQNYVIAGGLLGIGLLLYIITWFYNSAVKARRTRFRHPDDLGH
ncbi:APC family permease [Brachybacterium aquaticum]|uniref:Amino acid transporter n=1 Tax=Brachybacterium aquaticum TaxID=1432564 RepID=A0A841AGK2_9MICO|nr:APC family permease [Brachybacterium aquaticum]MBB5833123.1 amino acid transporter [Brachybacterium aquaticum]